MDSNICLDEILEINAIGEIETLDISVSGNNLFFANDILTHNSGASNSDASMADISESFGVAATADFAIALINTEELEKLGQLMIKQLKNRYNDVTKNKKFLVGIDRSKMRLFDIGDVQIDGEGGIHDPYQDYTYGKTDAPFGGSSYKKNFDNFKY
jgi:hypothetical protein